MTVIDLLEERAAREVPGYLEAFERGESFIEDVVFSSKDLARACAREFRREIRARRLDYSVTRRGSDVFLRNHAYWDDVEDELAQLLGALLRRTYATRAEGEPPAEAG
jgi:hypothetical protein